jgi:hypothetical protein
MNGDQKAESHMIKDEKWGFSRFMGQKREKDHGIT